MEKAPFIKAKLGMLFKAVAFAFWGAGGGEDGNRVK